MAISSLETLPIINELAPRIWTGNELAYYHFVESSGEDWSVVHACKEPFHRQLLGYTKRGAPTDHPEYLVARRGNRLYLNMVDASSKDYFPDELFHEALFFLNERYDQSRDDLFIHCNRGESRGPSVALLFLAQRGLFPQSLREAQQAMSRTYPLYAPGLGIQEYLEAKWNIYVPSPHTHEEG